MSRSSSGIKQCYLCSGCQGNTTRYEELRKKFQGDPEDPDSDGPSSRELQQTLTALTNVVSKLGQSCSSLIHDVVQTTWLGRDAYFVNVYVKFLGTLVSAHANHIGVVIKMLVKNFSLLPSSTGKLSHYPPVARGGRQGLYDRVHYALQYILELVPTAGHSTLFPALVAEFPYRDESEGVHTIYLRNFLQVIEYQPALREKILAVVTDKIIKLDIEIQVFLMDLSEEKTEEIEAAIYKTLEVSEQILDDTIGDIDMESESEKKEFEEVEEEYDDEPHDRIKEIKETAAKLDSMLDMLFTYYSPSFPIEHTDTPPTTAADTFDLLLRFLESTILPTYKSRFTQFLLFWAAQKSSLFADQLCVMLLGRAFDNTRPQSARQEAASYICGFVSRAQHINTNDVRAVVHILCRWLSEFVDQRSVECTGPDVSRWSGFYAIVQAVMYIFCFRWRDLRVREEDEFGVVEEHWTAGLSVMNKVICSRFNPLKVCAWAVVENFAEIAAHFQLVFCQTIIDQNRRNGLIKEGEMLDTYFPFDPYRLPKSRHWIDGIYLMWQPVEGLRSSDSGEAADAKDGK